VLQAFKRAVSTLVVEEAPSNRRQADRFDACGQRRTHQPPPSGPFRRLWSKTHPPTAVKQRSCVQPSTGSGRSRLCARSFPKRRLFSGIAQKLCDGLH
jgi:hypothetical protein